GWISPNIISFLGITCYYIDADWKVQDVFLDFISFTGSHSGENIANAFSQSL
ncbi:12753_t:CDS:1, partial [Funneliformis caledonium]